MVDLSFLEPIKELLKDDQVRGQIDETARIFFSNSGLTVNLIPALIVIPLALLLLLPLFGIPILDMLSSGMEAMIGGYGGHGYAFSRSSDTAYYDQTIAELQQQVASLQESEASLRSAVYYNSPAEAGAQATNQVGY